MIGFYHPVAGYWQLLSDPHPSIEAAYPQGTVRVPLRPSLDHSWSGREWVHEPPPPPPAPVPDPKLVGIEFQGVMCSATAEDQNGLAAVLVAIQLQGAEFQPTRLHFSNGNTIVLSLDNYQAFAAVWLPFRQSFFRPDA